MGPSGPVGLDYSVIDAFLDRKGVKEDEREDTMYAIGVIENAALDKIYEDKNGN